MRFNCFKKSYCLFFFLTITTSIIAQQTAINYDINANFHKATRLYNNKAYAASQVLFREVSNNSEKHHSLKADADYYDAMCAIKLQQDDADDRVMQFVENYPYNNKKEKAFLNVGNYYFANRKAAHSLKWYQKVNEKLLNQEERDELNYKMGYALLVSNYLKDAKSHFQALLGNPIYGNDARYYYGFIAYKQENFGEAEDNLSQLANDATYQAKANYYILDISFKAGRFDKSIQIGKRLLETSKDPKEVSEISKIVGESYFNLKKYEKAIPYLKEYKGKNGRWTNTDYYYLGYAYYQQKDYETAISNFNKIIGGNNKVAQNAYYHLAECYLELGKKLEALNAFKNASEMDFDAKITESASLNYAKLSYEEGNPYESVPDVLKGFLTKYPTSPNTAEISNLLVTSYLHQQDYQGALDFLKTSETPESKSIINEVSLYRGIQLFNENKITEAKPYFINATKSENVIIHNKGAYWLAETEYSLGNYQNALEYFLSVTDKEISEAKMLNYQIGYTNFKLKSYPNAAKYFQQFLEQNLDDNGLNDDASNRLGDAFYASKSYTNAINAYNKVIQEGGLGADYAQYQTAMSNGFLGKNDVKIKDLETLINEYEGSQLKDDALFQLATTYTTIDNTSKAQKTYERLLANYPTSNYVPNVLLRQGLLYYSKNNNRKAIEKYKEVVAKHPNSNEARQAVTNIKNVYIDLGKVDEYATWVKNVSFANVTNAELDNATYQSAENKFLENNNAKAIEGFNKYLQAFPNGINVLKAHFYLAQAYNNTKLFDNAIPHYTYVMKQSKSEFTEESLTKLANIYLEKQDWNNGILVLQQLEKDANYPQNIIFAQSNLMKGYYKKNDYSNAITYAEKVLTKEKLDTNIAEDAKIILARSSFKNNDFLTAEEYFNEASKKATGELKAECLYYNAFFLHENKEYEASTKAVQDLIANYSSYKYWGVKSYIIMAKNYYALKDAYQATYILENIIKNFTQYKDVIEEAKNELRTIKNKEAKTNESVTTQN
ncbi:tetratricopeptide repeat protein [Tenacibaculum caenipelagi]|uniref:Tetratricopeptide repeat protein n=1 Tax=Tenacibaculum caenipelagi TaxID=1325435 RepID=A0A4R6TKT6_9FLAO|nr:tetratricopeptide repeat protein [Tenacibaculum caenipelagi]TDQ30158.1 tetratricopeptide repeat protein [Tenacibaculum caenipelagi]